MTGLGALKSFFFYLWPARTDRRLSSSEAARSDVAELALIVVLLARTWCCKPSDSFLGLSSGGDDLVTIRLHQVHTMHAVYMHDQQLTDLQ